MPIGQNRDYRPETIPYNEPVRLVGRFTGNATGALVPVPGTTKSGLTIARTGVGAFTLTIPTPIGTPQLVDIWVNTPPAGNAKTTLVTPPSAANQTTIAFTVVLVSNSAAVTDIAATEEIDVLLMLAASAYP